MSYSIEGAFEEMLFMLHKMRWLAEMATSGTLTLPERERIQLEIDSLKEGIDRVAEEIRAYETSTSSADGVDNVIE